MDYNEKLTFYDERTLLVVNPKGLLKQLHVPFQVKCIIPSGLIKTNTMVYVDAVAQHQKFRIMYRVLNQWIPYQHFQIMIRY
ncbi:hypothetical protein [Daejeonella oryzae]|uniref:hypothetical protein n=1 Tax=Daejeonella oryzae TaxID=1122943 RepID=UPI0004798AAB|nr:hypothetical protein [Daejeonella oryzae]